jgi:aryl-alcohol dehydrogenase-like predicted oxidoreductase
MKYVRLGRTGLNVSRLALGTATYGVSPLEADVPAMIHRGLELGINIIDTSNSYGHQPRFDQPWAPPAAERKPAEEMVGAAIKGHRHEIILCSKVMEPVYEGPNGRGLSRKHIMEQIDISLRRLDTDYLDVYYAHHPDPFTPLDQTLRTFDDLIRMGKIRYYALSTFPAWQLTYAIQLADKMNISAPIVDQVNYNLVNRAVETEIVPASLQFGTGLTVFGPLFGGLLAGISVLERPVQGSQRWTGRGFTEHEIELGRQLDSVAKETGYKPAHLALAWLMSRPAVATCIVGPENLYELEENIAAADLDVPDEVMERVDAIGKVVGPSMPR